jgi:hypothetical protein
MKARYQLRSELQKEWLKQIEDNRSKCWCISHAADRKARAKQRKLEEELKDEQRIQKERKDLLLQYKLETNKTASAEAEAPDTKSSSSPTPLNQKPENDPPLPPHSGEKESEAQTKPSAILDALNNICGLNNELMNWAEAIQKQQTELKARLDLLKVQLARPFPRLNHEFPRGSMRSPLERDDRSCDNRQNCLHQLRFNGEYSDPEIVCRSNTKLPPAHPCLC